MINKTIPLSDIECAAIVRFAKHILMVFSSPFDFPHILQLEDKYSVPHYYSLDEVQYEGNMTYCIYRPSLLAFSEFQDSKGKFDIVVI